jgi:tRNA(fMet)-specific endonuclease VapC
MDGLRYLLDTNILSALIRQPLGPVAAMLTRRGHGTVCTSIVVAAELRFGARKLGSSVLSRKVDDLLVTAAPVPE